MCSYMTHVLASMGTLSETDICKLRNRCNKFRAFYKMCTIISYKWNKLMTYLSTKICVSSQKKYLVFNYLIMYLK